MLPAFATSIMMDTRDAPTPADDIERRVAFEAIRGRLFAGDAQPVAIGRFLVTSRVGQGGMGVVYSAYDPQLDRRVAVKVVRDLGRDADEIERARRSLEREARAAAGLAHPNVVTVYDSGATADGFYVAMEFVPGPTLRQWLQRRPRAWPEILRMFVAAGRGLQAAHAAALVHCDFKPDNVLVGADDRPRVADFGLVKHTGLRSEPPSLSDARALTQGSSETGTSIGGTPRYMAPEQYDGKGIGPHSDQFAFCVALYEALFGAHPYPRKGDGRPDVVAGELARAHERSPVPRAIARDVLRGLHRDPPQRHPSMEALLDRLERGLRRRGLWRLALLGAAATSLALGTGYALADDPVDPCENATAPLAAHWNDETRSELHATLKAVAGPAEAVDLGRRLAAHADEWGSMRSESCEATHHHGEQSAELFELRTACLDRNLNALVGTLALIRTLGPEQGPDARGLVEALRPVEVCAAAAVRVRSMVRNAGLATTDRSRDAESERAFVEVGALIDEARQEKLVGSSTLALARAEQAEQRARAARLRYSEAEAMLLRVSLQVEDGRTETAEADLRRALALATEADDPLGAVQTVVALLRLSRQGGPKVENRRLLVELGRAWAGRTGRATELRAELEFEAAADANGKGQHDEALALIDAALASLAAESLEQATVAHKLRLLRGQALLGARRLPEAEATLSSLLADQRARLPAGHVDLADTAFQLGEVLRMRGRLDEALPLVEEARTVWAARLGSRDDRLFSAERILGELWQAKGEPARAARAFEAAIAGHQRAHGSFQGKQAIYLGQLAELELEAGELARAQQHAHLSATIAAKAFGREHTMTTALGITLGKAELERGRLEIAHTLLETARVRLRGPKDDPAWAAEAAWHLARLALRSKPPDHARALALAVEAEAGLQKASGAHVERMKEEIARWRATLPPDRPPPDP